jgi:hypothetical protein
MRKCAVSKCKEEAIIKVVTPTSYSNVQLAFHVCKEHSLKISAREKDVNLYEMITLEQELALYKKALELACDEIISCPIDGTCEKDCINCWQDHFLTKAKGGE